MITFGLTIAFKTFMKPVVTMATSFFYGCFYHSSQRDYVIPFFHHWSLVVMLAERIVGFMMQWTFSPTCSYGLSELK